MATNARFWIAGTAVAVLGVILVRVVAPFLGGTTRITLTVGGQLLGLVGLFIICIGVRQRIQRASGR